MRAVLPVLFSAALLCISLMSAVPLAAQPQLDFADLLDEIRFRSIGPTRQGGRIVTFSVSEQDPLTFFAGAGPGGLFKTTNGGHSFISVFDEGGVGSIGDVAIAPSDPSIVWLGTGEGNLRNSTYYGDGVYRSDDGGASWQHRGLPESRHISRVLVHPDDPDTVWVAAQGALYSDRPERGLYKTTNGGESWRQVLAPTVEGRTIGATEVLLDPLEPDTLWAVSYDRRRFAWSFRTAGRGSGIYKSTDGGENWRKLESGLPGGFLGRIGLDLYRGEATAPESAPTLYATIDNQNSTGLSEEERGRELALGLPPSKPTFGHGIYRSDDGGESWRRVSPEGRRVGDRSNYYGQIIVAPDDPDRVFVLSSGCDESRDGGRSWQRCFRFGGDNHVLWIDPRDSRHWLLGYDYGLAISRDGGANWYHPDELALAQTYAVSVDDARPYNVYLGVQDFGSWRGPSTKKGRFPIRFEDWEHTNGGDGMENLVDPANRRWLFSSAQFGDLVRIDQQTGDRREISLQQGPDGERLRYHWKAPLAFSPHRDEVLYQGANRLLETADRGETWRVISPDLTTADPQRIRGIGAVQYCTLTAVAESALSAGELWVGTDDGNLWLRRSPEAQWQRINDNLPPEAHRSDSQLHWVTRVVPSTHQAGTAWVSLSAFHEDDFRPMVFRTDDAGESWRPAVEGLPEASVNVIRESPRRPGLLFAGHDKGLSVTLDGGRQWQDLGDDLPTIPVRDLVVHHRNHDLIVGTHGRGIYIADINWLEQWQDELLEQEAHLFEVEPIVQWRMTSQPARSAQNLAGENAAHSVVLDYLIGASPAGSNAPARLTVRQGGEVLQVIEGPSTPGLHRVEWGMTRVETRSDEDRLRWAEEQAMLAADEEFFDYYDTVEQFAEPGEEVDRFGRSLRTRVHRPPGETERDVRYLRVGPGQYTVRLEVADQVGKSRPLVLLEDR